MPPVMLQMFHWYLPGGATWWTQVAERAGALAEAGFTEVWLPPASKGHVGGYDVGYGVYDLYDLGEFDQKGTVATKYGTRAEYIAAIRALQDRGLAVFADIVWNHRLGGDAPQRVRATPYSTWDRLHPSGPEREVEVWTRFEFAGRGGAHDPRTLEARHFVAVDHDARSPHDGDTIYLLGDKHFDPDVDAEHGNFHFLMGCDIDQSDPEVQAMTLEWTRWFLDTTGVDGLRLDAVKHIPAWALCTYVDAAREHAHGTTGSPLPVIGEYWSGHLPALEHFLGASGDRMALFDVPLHFTFHRASLAGADFDLRTVFDRSLVATQPEAAVTFVENHDSQPLQALASPVEAWFKPIAYALILLRRAGHPCVFLGDYDGADYADGSGGQVVHVHLPSMRPLLDLLLGLRRELGDAEQADHFDGPNLIGWTRAAGGLRVAVLVSNGGGGVLHIPVGVPGLALEEATGSIPDPAVVGPDGIAALTCPAGGLAVWVARDGDVA